MMNIGSLSYKKLILGLGFCILGLGVTQAANDYCEQGDLLQQAYCMANRNDTVLDFGNTKTAVGGKFFKWQIQVKIEGWIKIEQTGNTIVQITKFILMLTIVLAVTMVIFNGMQYIIASGSGNDPKKAQSNLIYIVVGIIIALFSVVIVNLLRSTGTTLYKEVSKNVNSLMSKDISSLS